MPQPHSISLSHLRKNKERRKKASVYKGESFRDIDWKFYSQGKYWVA